MNKSSLIKHNGEYLKLEDYINKKIKLIEEEFDKVKNDKPDTIIKFFKKTVKINIAKYKIEKLQKKYKNISIDHPILHYIIKSPNYDILDITEKDLDEVYKIYNLSYHKTLNIENSEFSVNKNINYCIDEFVEFMNRCIIKKNLSKNVYKILEEIKNDLFKNCEDITGWKNEEEVEKPVFQKKVNNDLILQKYGLNLYRRDININEILEMMFKKERHIVKSFTDFAKVLNDKNIFVVLFKQNNKDIEVKHRKNKRSDYLDMNYIKSLNILNYFKEDRFVDRSVKIYGKSTHPEFVMLETYNDKTYNIFHGRNKFMLYKPDGYIKIWENSFNSPVKTEISTPVEESGNNSEVGDKLDIKPSVLPFIPSPDNMFYSYKNRNNSRRSIIISSEYYINFINRIQNGTKTTRIKCYNKTIDSDVKLHGFGNIDNFIKRYVKINIEDDYRNFVRKLIFKLDPDNDVELSFNFIKSEVLAFFMKYTPQNTNNSDFEYFLENIVHKYILVIKKDIIENPKAIFTSTRDTLFDPNGLYHIAIKTIGIIDYRHGREFIEKEYKTPELKQDEITDNSNDKYNYDQNGMPVFLDEIKNTSNKKDNNITYDYKI